MSLYLVFNQVRRMNRNNRLLVICRFAVVILCLLTTVTVTAQQRPNIIVFMVDDMGWMDTSVPFGDSTYPLNKKYHTPNMERLAREGMKFTSAYATPVCTPSRLSLLTGMNAAHHKVTNWTSPLANNPTDVLDKQFDAPNWNYNGISTQPNTAHSIYATALPQLLKDVGYFTVHVGKAHWGSAGTTGSNPYNLGFMVNIAGHAGGHPQSYYGKDNYGNIPGKAGLQAVPDLQQYHGTDTFLTEALTLEAIKTLQAPVKRKQPFFLHIAHYAVHLPIQADKRYLQKYLAAGLDTLEAGYASLIEGMDKSLGDIMDYLTKAGIEKNTVIIFMSDNGGISNPGTRSGKPFMQNYPLRAGKGSVYEGGIREPMIVKWPAVVKPSTVAKQPVIIEDFFPTILEIAKLKNYKTVQVIDGRSLLPILKSPSYADSSRVLIWHLPNKWINNDGPGINFYSAIRQGNWKLVYSMRTGKMELYNVANDIGETVDLYSLYPEKVKQLSALLANRLTTWESPMPKDKQTGKPVSIPLSK